METQVWFWGWEGTQEKGLVNHSIMLFKFIHCEMLNLNGAIIKAMFFSRNIHILNKRKKYLLDGISNMQDV